MCRRLYENLHVDKNSSRGGQRILWLGQEPEAERVLNLFKERKIELGGKTSHVMFLHYLLHLYEDPQSGQR